MAYAGKNGYDKDTDILSPIASNIIGWVGKADREEILNLSFERISLYQVGKILEKLGYQNIDMSENGWEMDYWWEYELANNAKDIPDLPCRVQIQGSCAEGTMMLNVLDNK